MSGRCEPEPVDATIRNHSTQSAPNQTQVDFLSISLGISLPRNNFGTTFAGLMHSGFRGSGPMVTMVLPAVRQVDTAP
jgi:hypothetical protein